MLQMCLYIDNVQTINLGTNIVYMLSVDWSLYLLHDTSESIPNHMKTAINCEDMSRTMTGISLHESGSRLCKFFITCSMKTE